MLSRLALVLAWGSRQCTLLRVFFLVAFWILQSTVLMLGILVIILAFSSGASLFFMP